MSKSDWFQLLLNAFIAFALFVGAVNASTGMEVTVYLLATLAVIINSGLISRGRREARPTPPIAETPVDELDAHAILDLDARLEAVERAQAASPDAELWQALAESGQARSPAAPAEGSGTGPRPGRRTDA